MEFDEQVLTGITVEINNIQKVNNFNVVQGKFDVLFATECDPEASNNTVSSKTRDC